MSAAENERHSGLTASQMEILFRRAVVMCDELNTSKGAKGKATVIGRFLSRHVNREVSIEVDGRAGRAKLCAGDGRSRSRLYFFEVRWDDPTASPSAPAPTLELAPGSHQVASGCTSEVTGAVVAEEVSEPRPPTPPPVGLPGGNGEQW